MNRIMRLLRGRSSTTESTVALWAKSLVGAFLFFGIFMVALPWVPHRILSMTLPLPPLLRTLGGGALFVIGVGAWLVCLDAFSRRGRGTPAPTDAPRHLVVDGLHGVIRNPIIAAEMLVIWGEALWFSSLGFITYAVLMMFYRFHGPAQKQGSVGPPPATGVQTEAAAVIPAAGTVTAQASREENETAVETDRFTVIFSDIGGTVKQFSLKDYSNGGEEEILLLEKNPLKRPFSLQSGLIAGLGDARHSMSKGAGYIEYQFTEQGFLEITKRFSFHNSFDYIDLDVKIRNLSSRPIDFSYVMTGPSGMQKSGKIMGRSFWRPIRLSTARSYARLRPNSPRNKSAMSTGQH